MINAMLLSADGACTSGGLELLHQWREDSDTFLWMDFEGKSGDEVRDLLSSMGCDELAISDSFRERHPPKVELFADNTFILFRGMSKLDESLELVPQQIGMWVARRHLITVHQGHSMSVEYFWREAEREGLVRQPGALALKILHYASGRYLSRLLEFEARLAELEDGLLTEHSEEDMKELVAVRSRLRRLRRIFSYHKVLAEQVWREGSVFLGHGDDELEHERRNLYDRCERVYSLCDMYYELCGDLIEGHISLSSHNLNQTMKVLTIISALFVPLTFVAGIYGMNFQYMPELGWRYGYFVVIAVMLVMASAMLALFRRIRWL